jgi:hypothetical protein
MNERLKLGSGQGIVSVHKWVVVAAMRGRPAPGQSWPLTVPIGSRKAAPGNVAAFPFSRLNVSISGKCIWEQISRKRTLRTTCSAIAWASVPLRVRFRESREAASTIMIRLLRRRFDPGFWHPRTHRNGSEWTRCNNRTLQPSMWSAMAPAVVHQIRRSSLSRSRVRTRSS